MAWPGAGVPNQVLDDLITPALWNAVSDAINESAPAKVTTAGDLVQATALNAISRLAIGTAGEFLRVNSGATAVEYSTMNEDSGGSVFVGSGTTNANMTQGVTVRQGSNSDEIGAYGSSDVAHGVTDEAETDIFGTIQKESGATGGLEATGYTEDMVGVKVRGVYTNGDTGKTAGSVAGIVFEVAKKSGTGVGAQAASENIALFRSRFSAVWILDKEGDIFYSGADDGTITDDRDDVPLLVAFRAINAPQGSPARERFKGFLKDKERILKDIGVLSSDGGMVSTKGLNGLMIDAMNQMYNKIGDLEARLAKHEGAA